jgi:hypothetical protein
MLRLEDNAEEEGYLDATLFFTCRLPGIVIGPSVLFATCTDSRQQPPDDSEQCSEKPTDPSALHFITKNLGRIPFCLRLFTQNPHRME